MEASSKRLPKHLCKLFHLVTTFVIHENEAEIILELFSFSKFHEPRLSFETQILPEKLIPIDRKTCINKEM